MEYRIIIAGTRDFNDYPFLKEKAEHVLSELKAASPTASVRIISGGARGADLLGERFASENKIPISRFPANWYTYGRAAGPIRNKQMLDFAMEDHAVVIAFWNGLSRGTRNMINLAKQEKVPVHLYMVGIG